MHAITTSLLKELKAHLDIIAVDLVDDLVRISNNELHNRREGVELDQVATLYFEYSYDDLQLYFWEEDANEKVLSNTIFQLPSRQEGGLVPKKLRDQIFDLEDVLYEDEDLEDEAVEEEVEQFNEARCAMFETWFLVCWSLARKQMTWNKRGYFSVHDSNYKTKLD